MDRRIKPYDAVFCYKWFSGCIEFKYTKTKSRYPYKLLKGSSVKNPWWQVKWLWEVIENWWFALVIIYNSIIKSYRIYDFSSLYPELKDNV